MDIDIQLSNVGLRQVIIFKYKIGDCLFGAITYFKNFHNNLNRFNDASTKLFDYWNTGGIIMSKT
jgi:hypothetical protein